MLKVLRDFDGDGLPDILVASDDFSHHAEWCKNLGKDQQAFAPCQPISSLPPNFMAFRETWSKAGTSFTLPGQTDPWDRHWMATLIDLIDVNRDGFPDYVVVENSPVGGDNQQLQTMRYRIYLHNGNVENPGWTATPTYSDSFAPCNLPDVDLKIACLALSFQEAARNRPFDSPPSYPRNRVSTFELRDVNGDGLPDRIVHPHVVDSSMRITKDPATSSTVAYLGAFLSEPSGAAPVSAAIQPTRDQTERTAEEHPYGPTYWAYETTTGYSQLLVDLNGDGRLDQLSMLPASLPASDDWLAFFQSRLSWAGGMALWSRPAASGLTLSTSAEQWDVINVSPPDTPTLPQGFVVTRSRMAVVDADGDGLADLLIAPSTAGGDWTLARSSAGTVRRGLLTQIRTEAIATHISYTTSRSFQNQDMPSAVTVVELVSTIDPHKYDSTATGVEEQYYGYADGLYDRTRREFRGFGKIWVRDNSAGAPRQTYTEYHTSDELKGKPLEQIVGPYPVNDTNWEKKTEWTWTPETISVRGQSWPVHHLTSKRTQLRNGPGRDDWVTYDNFIFGLPRNTVHKGDPGTTSDDIAVLQTYVYKDNGFDFLVLPSLTEKTRGAVYWGRKRITYDNLSFAAAPTQGRVTKVETLVDSSPETYKTEEFGYTGAFGQYGLATSWQSSTGEQRTMGYSDAGFMIQVDKPAGASPAMTWTYHWQHLTGRLEAECGPQKSALGFLRCHTNALDPHGRLLEEREAKINGSNQWVSVVVARYDYSDSATVTPNMPRWVKKTTYPDGLGGEATPRVVQVYVDAAGREIGRAMTHGTGSDHVYVATGRRQGRVVHKTLPLPVSDDAFQPDYLSGSPSKTTFGYDLLGRETSNVDPAGNVVTTQYTGDTVSVDRAGESTLREHDVFGRVTRITKAQTGGDYWVDFGYDVNNHITQVGVENGTRSRSYTRNLLGQATAITLPNGDDYSYTYWSPGGKIRRVSDSRQAWMEMSYDDLRRTTRVDFDGPSRPDVAIPGPLEYSYFTDDLRLGHLWKICDSEHCTERDVNARGQVLSLTRRTEEGEYGVEMSYNDLGEVTHRTLSRSGFGVEYIYDAAGRVSSILADSGLSVDATYHPTGAVANYLVSEGSTVLDSTRTYDTSGRLFTISTTASASECDRNVTSITYTPRNAVENINDAAESGEKWYGHDRWDRLVSAANTGGNWGFTYQAPGLMHLSGAQSETGGQEPYTYSTHDVFQVAFVEGQSGVRGYTYDEAGNLSQTDLDGQPLESLAWTPSNQLWSVESEATSAYFRYVGGERYRRTIRQFGDLVEDRIFVGDADYDVRDGVGSLHLSVGGRPLVTIKDDETYNVYSYDVSGVRCVMDREGQVATRAYTPYGRVTSAEGDQRLFAFGFKGYREIPALGWSRTPARVYSPELRRWFSRDPLYLAAPSPGELRPLDLYSYANSDPVSLVDPSGLDPREMRTFSRNYRSGDAATQASIDRVNAALATRALLFVADVALTIATDGAWAAYAAERYGVATASYNLRHYVTLYRGVNATHAKYAQQSTGLVTPNRRWWQFWRGKSTALQHNTGKGGTLNSPYTSWTTDPKVAKNFAQRPPGTGGVVLEARVHVSKVRLSPNLHEVRLPGGSVVSEAEVLVKGAVRASRVGHVPPAIF